MEIWGWYSNDSFSSDEWYSFFTKWRSIGFKGFNINCNGGEDVVKVVAEAGEKAGIKINLWYWILNVNNDKFVQENHPELFNVNRDGKDSLNHPQYVDYYKWLCPQKDKTFNYLKSKIEPLLKYKFNSIHFDYIRHPDIFLPIGLQPHYGIVQDREFPEYDYCYCEKCRSDFRDEYGEDPLSFDDPSQIYEWKLFRLRSVNRLVNRLNRFITSSEREVSAAVFPHPSMARDMVRQEWNRWEISAFFPMIYFQFYNESPKWLGDVVKKCRVEMGKDRKLYAGIYLPEITKDQLRESIIKSKENGADGICLFSVDNLDEELISVLEEFSN